MSDAPVSPGDILAGKYRVERILGAGNMGVVVAATNLALERLVALKFMLPGKGLHPQQQERFLREARAAARLKSQHVAQVLDMGTLENGAPYTVMEFLEGQDLSALLRERGPLPVEEAVLYLLQVCEAMGEAHAAGIVHRDLKPANLFLIGDISGSPCVKVLDFGVSKLSGALTLTQEEQQLGSPLYMSPEQMNASKSVDARSDIWALGVVLHQLVSGHTPFDAESLHHLYARVFFGQPTPLREHRQDAPPELEAVILRCLEKDPDKRWLHVAELAAAVAPYASAEARVYAERVARVLGGKTPRLPSLPEAMPLKVSIQASSTPMQPPTVATTTGPMVYRAPLPATGAFSDASKTEPFFGPHPAMAANPPSVGSDPSLPPTIADPAERLAALAPLANPPARWGLVLAGALVTLAVPVAVLVGLSRREPGLTLLPGSSASAETLVRPSAQLVPVTLPGSATASAPASTAAAPAGSAPPPAASSSAPGAAPPPAGTSRTTSRTAGAGTAAKPSKGSDPPSQPMPTTRPSHHGMD